MVRWATALEHSIPKRKDQIVQFHNLKVGKKGNVMKNEEIRVLLSVWVSLLACFQPLKGHIKIV